MLSSLTTSKARHSVLPVLFIGGGYLSSYLELGNYDVAPDGQHFLMIKEKETSADSKELGIVLHWTDELKRLAPASKH